MRTFLLRRLGLVLVTLVVVSLLVFVLSQVLPGDVGRTILGPYASNEQVAALNHDLGYDRPVVTRYFEWLGGFVTGDWGDSPVQQVPIRPLVMDSLGRSLVLALVALVMIVPVSVGAGLAAGLRAGSPLDRGISVGGLALTGVPEVVSGVVLLLVFAVGLGWFPVSAQTDGGAADQVYHLILPALALAPVLFGYLARMARAGTVEVLDSDYVRSAVLKGLPRRRVVTRHVLRNSMGPTVTVIGTQIGWLVGGLVVIESLFNYPGIGKLLLDSAKQHDVPLLEAATVVVAIVFMLANLAADLVVAALNPRVRDARA